ncbi:hypothetical protein OG937_11530 [Streptomyces sp. NBC_00510]
MVLTAALAGPAHPAPAAAAALQGLGAHYDATGSAIGFRVYSARATRIEVYLYKSPSGAQEQAGLPLTVDPATRV